MKKLTLVLMSLLVLTVALAGCGGEEPTPIILVATPTQAAVTVVVTPPPPAAPTEAAATGIELEAVTFAHGLGEQMEPLDPGSDFQSDETVYLSVQIKGRPKTGVLTARFSWRDDLIAEANVDLADVNSGLLFSIGEDTYAGYTLTHDQPFPLSDRYRADLFYEGQPLGSQPFRIVPPPEAIPSQITQVTLALGADEDYNPVDPTTAFAFDETVYLVGRGDLGMGTWVQAEWYVNGQLDEAGTRSLTLDENLPGAAFAFSFLPDGGWPPGEHSVVLMMNDVEVGRYPFTVVSSGGAAPLDDVAFWDAFPLPDDAEITPVVEGYDLGFATAWIEPQLFDYYAAWLRDQGWQQQAPTEAMQTLPHQLWRKDDAELLLEIQGLDDQGRTVVWVQLALPSADLLPSPTEQVQATAPPPMSSPPPAPTAETITPANAPQLTQIGQVAVGSTRPTLAWSPDGRWLALARNDTATGIAYLALFEAQSLTEINPPTPIQASHVAFSPDGRFLAVSFRDGQDRVVVWDAPRLFQGTAQQVSSFTGSFGGILGLAFSPDSRLLALAVSAAQGSIVPLLDAESGQLVRTLQVSYQGAHAPMVFDVAFSPDGALAAATTYGGLVQVWRVTDGSTVVTVRTGVTEPHWIVFLSPDRFVTAGYPTAIIWDLNGTQLAGLTDGSNLATLDVTPDGGLVGGAGPDQVGFWDATNGAPLASIAARTRVQVLRFGPGARVAMLDEDGVLSLWGVGAEKATPLVEGRYADVWARLGGAEGRLGQPLGPAVEDTFAFQHFERGLMHWGRWDTEGAPEREVQVIVYGEGGSNRQAGDLWGRFIDYWQEGDDEYSCPEAQPPYGPRQGFGLVWCQYVRDSLGAPLEGEYGLAAGYQDFQGGALLWSPSDDGVYVLFNQGDWQFETGE